MTEQDTTGSIGGIFVVDLHSLDSGAHTAELEETEILCDQTIRELVENLEAEVLMGDPMHILVDPYAENINRISSFVIPAGTRVHIVAKGREHVTKKAHERTRIRSILRSAGWTIPPDSTYQVGAFQPVPSTYQSKFFLSKYRTIRV